MSAKIVFFELENWEKDYLRERAELISVEPLFIDQALNDQTIDELVSTKAEIFNEAEVISIFVNSVVNERILACFPKLKLIATRSTGYDHLNLFACQARGIIVSNVPTYGEETVAEYTFALLLTLSRKIFESYDRIRETGSFSLEGMRGFDLHGKTLGVIGTGKIGKNVIEIAKGFNMEVIAYDKFPDETYCQKMGYVYKTLDEVLAQADILTLHVPYLPENHHLINSETIKKMKKGVYLVNTARGSLVDTEALLQGLREGLIAGAGLDVLEEEGMIKDELNFLTSGQQLDNHNLKTVLQNHLLVDMPNVVITPHNAFNTWEALKRILDTTANNIKAFLAGQPVNIVK